MGSIIGDPVLNSRAQQMFVNKSHDIIDFSIELSINTWICFNHLMDLPVLRALIIFLCPNRTWKIKKLEKMLYLKQACLYRVLQNHRLNKFAWTRTDWVSRIKAEIRSRSIQDQSNYRYEVAKMSEYKPNLKMGNQARICTIQPQVDLIILVRLVVSTVLIQVLWATV